MRGCRCSDNTHGPSISKIEAYGHGCHSGENKLHTIHIHDLQNTHPPQPKIEEKLDKTVSYVETSLTDFRLGMVVGSKKILCFYILITYNLTYLTYIYKINT